MRGTARINGHTLKLSYLEAGRGKAAFIPAATRSHCIFKARDLGILAFVFGCAVDLLILGVYWSFIAEWSKNPV
jgi:hypothetical protein